LADAFKFALDLFKWMLTNNNPVSNLIYSFDYYAADLMDSLGFDLTHDLAEKLRESLRISQEKYNAKKATPLPVFNQSDATKQAANKLAESFRETIDTALDPIGLSVEELQSNFDRYKDEAISNFDKFANFNPENYVPQTDTATDTEDKTDIANGTSVSNLTTIDDVISGALGGLGDFGTLMNGITAGLGPLNIVLQVITSLINALMSIENFAKVFNFMGTIFNEMAAVIAPLVNELLAPVVGILEKIGNLIGQLLSGLLKPLMHFLEPFLLVISSILEIIEGFIPILSLVFSIIGELLVIFNPLILILQVFSGLIMTLWNTVLSPVCWAIYTAVGYVYNAIAFIINALAASVNWIPGVNISGMTPIALQSFDSFQETYKKNTKDAYDLKLGTGGNNMEDQYNSNGGSYSNTSASSASGSASYAAARDINVFISYHKSYVNGDAREIAVNLRNEIRMAEALGL
jgi:hypothetical protein